MKYASAGDKQMQCKEKVPLTSVLIQPTEEVSWSFNFKVECKSEENEDKMMDGGDGHDDFDDGQDEDKMMDGGLWKAIYAYLCSLVKAKAEFFSTNEPGHGIVKQHLAPSLHIFQSLHQKPSRPSTHLMSSQSGCFGGNMQAG